MHSLTTRKKHFNLFDIMWFSFKSKSSLRNILESNRAAIQRKLYNLHRWYVLRRGGTPFPCWKLLCWLLLSSWFYRPPKQHYCVSARVLLPRWDRGTVSVPGRFLRKSALNYFISFIKLTFFGITNLNYILIV